MELLDDRPTHAFGVLALHDERPSGAVDDFLHENVSPLVTGFRGLTNVLVAEIAKDVLHQILELEAGEVVQQFSHLDRTDGWQRI
jgi:hypothetical protein